MRIIKLTSLILLIIAASFYFRHTRSSPATISVMTFNIENGGTQIDFNKVVEAIKKSKADVVGIQEAWGHTPLLAKKLGWQYYDSRQHIVSRYPLREPADSHGMYTLVEIKPGWVVAMANMHLPDGQYGPDQLHEGDSIEAVESAERQIRLPVALPFIEKLGMLAKNGTPVFLTGDFNSPSHLDWVHHQPAMRWPVTKTAEQNGLIDAYRQIYPDILKYRASTWPAGRPAAIHSFDGFNPSTQDLPDRIDFIYTGGNSQVISAAIVGEPAYQAASIKVWPWPSDHRAVVARFKIIPVPLATFQLQPAPTKSMTVGSSRINVNKTRVKSGEPFTLSWHHSPSHRLDYILIAPVGSKKIIWGETVRLYTYGQTNGTIVYNDKSAKGNWLLWHTGNKGKWPMKPGVYNIRLMLDDSYTELARTQVKVIP